MWSFALFIPVPWIRPWYDQYSLLLLLGRYCTGEPGFIPATPLGVLEMLKRCQVETFGKTACVVGRSKNIGKFRDSYCLRLRVPVRYEY